MFFTLWPQHEPTVTSHPSSPVIADVADYNREMLNYVKVSVWDDPLESEDG